MSAEADRVRWGIVGPGHIAKSFLGGISHSRTGRLVAIGSRSPNKEGLAEAFPGARILNGYQALIDAADVEAVYISTPHPSHVEWAIKAAEAGKHALVEKPMGLTVSEVEGAFDAHRRAGTFVGEAYMYRLHPQTAKLGEMVASGTIGEVRMIKSSFGFSMPPGTPAHWLYAKELAGGCIFDVGGYPVSMARFLAGAAAGKPFLDPASVTGTAHVGATGVDEWASAVLHFPNGIIAEVSCSISLQQENVLRVIGTAGRIEVADFWFGGGRQGGTGRLNIVRHDGPAETVEVREERWLYSFEADAAGEAIRAGRQEFSPPGMGWADSLGNAHAIDQWRATAGLDAIER